MEKRYREDDMEIDLLELLFEFKKRAWVIILAAVWDAWAREPTAA